MEGGSLVLCNKGLLENYSTRSTTSVAVMELKRIFAQFKEWQTFQSLYHLTWQTGAPNKAASLKTLFHLTTDCHKQILA